ncbi:hypothetical protein [Thermomonospora umbrina]|uniref:Mce-associated membrane protein n=1 Tax=Thermomonospora umbrina TaxID=111806 RepID=A0A3D9T1C2_9ACTN|nr:hypothetical protein [Thermomonospora umbrina]REF00631.1 hypothetical protein DFJ69_6187 [Thermomonospora umbrina]
MPHRPTRAPRTALAALLVATVTIAAALTWMNSPHTRPRSAEPPSSPAPRPAPFDIHTLLPLPRTQLAAAAHVALRFTTAHGTYRFDENPQTYLRRLAPTVTPALHTELHRTTTSPPLLAHRRQHRMSAHASARLEALRDVQPTSVIYVIACTQQVTSADEPPHRLTRRYTLTVTKDTGGWRVHALRPIENGQHGEQQP